MIYVGVVGSRRRGSEEDFKKLCLALSDWMDENDIKIEDITLVSGGCKEGGDQFAEILADQYHIPIIIHYPDKSQLPPSPKRWDFAKINYARNTLIARDSVVLFAIVAEDRKGGTEDTVKKFEKFRKTMVKGPLILV